MTPFRAFLGFAVLVLCAVPLLVYSGATPPGAAVAGGDLNLTFSTIDVPGAVNTIIDGINSAGDVVGWYQTTLNGAAEGFLLSGGSFTFFDYPGADSTEPFEINDLGLISGTALVKQSTGAVGFLYDGTTFTTVRVGSNSATLVHGINNSGAVVGSYGSLALSKGFELIGTRFRKITPPDASGVVSGNGINNLGEIVGSESGSPETGFAFRSGIYQTLAYPGALLTAAWGVNDNGFIAGSYQGCSVSACAFHGFVFANGKYASLDYPDSVDTVVFGLNNAGQIVGSYTLDGQTFHGFVTNPANLAESKAGTDAAW